MRSIFFSLLFACLLPQALQANVVFVTQNASGANTGLSWADAYASLQDALANAEAGDTLWVAAGIYTPTNGTDRYISFVIPSAVALYGGFAGTESSLAARDWLANPTVLSGDIGVPLDSTDNSIRVIRLANAINITLDGFTVTGGNNDNPVPSVNGRSGGGMHLSNARCSLYNMVFIENTARFGGAIALWSNAALTLENCIFRRNTANGANDRCGGAIFAEDEFLECSFLNCRFLENVVSYSGGGGGAVSGGANTFINCVFRGNKAAFGGAIISSNSTVYQSTFWGQKTSYGLLASGNYLCFNTIFWYNGGATLFESDASFSACLLEEAQCPNGATCDEPSMAYNKDPYIVSPFEDDFGLSLCSPAVNAGLNANIPAMLMEDAAGQGRIIYGIVDLGAYEFLDTEPQYRPADVTSTSGNLAARTLAGAIVCANAQPGPDTIRFLLPGAGLHTISPLYTLPVITGDSTVIDASDLSAGYIRLGGSQVQPLYITEDQSGLRCTGKGIELYGMDIRDFNNSGINIFATASNLRIGAPGKGNIIWGNHMENIRLRGEGHILQSNYIGVTPAGIVSPVGTKGIYLFPNFTGQTTQNILIGGSRAAGEGNVFGSLDDVISCPDISGTTETAHDIDITGNYFGTTPDEALFFPTGNPLRLYADNFYFEDVRFGGSTLDQGNVVAHTSGSVYLVPYTVQVAINHNKFYCNYSGISINPGGNAGILPPTIYAADIFHISGTAVPGQVVEIYISDNSGCPDIGSCQGTFYLGEVTAGPTGNWLLNSFQQPLYGGERVTATATNSLPVTSEFAACATVICPESYGTLEQVLCANESLLINETLYNIDNPSGTEVLTDASAIGCDSILTVSLSFLPIPQGSYDATLCEGDSLVVGATVFNIQHPTGLAAISGAAANGCDSLVSVNLSFLPLSVVNMDTAICTGDTLWVGGNALVEAGQYTYAFLAANGCDSIINVTLSLLPLPSRTAEATICEGEAFEFQGESLSVSGYYQATVPAPSGCDSLLVLHLEVAPLYADTLLTGFCEGTLYPFCGGLLDTPGTYSCYLQSAAGCDSIITLQLQLLAASESILDTTLCAGEQLRVGDTLFGQAGDYQVLLANAAGCDSTVFLNLGYASLSDNPVATIEPDLGFGNGAIRITLNSIGLELSWEDNSSDTLRNGLAAGAYELIITDSLGCEYSYAYEVPKGDLYVDTPNAFTPNEDGDNDFFNVLSNFPGLEVVSFKVFNRWGQAVYDNETPDTGWDGSFREQPQPADTYFFLIEVGLDNGARNTKVLKGDVTLLR